MPGERTTRDQHVDPQKHSAKYEKPAAKDHTSYDPILTRGPGKGRLKRHQGHGWLLGCWDPCRGRAHRGQRGLGARMHNSDTCFKHHGAVHLQRLSFRGRALPSSGSCCGHGSSAPLRPLPGRALLRAHGPPHKSRAQKSAPLPTARRPSGGWPQRRRRIPGCDGGRGCHRSHARDAKPSSAGVLAARRRGRQRLPKMAPPPARLSAQAPAPAFGVRLWSRAYRVLCIYPRLQRTVGRSTASVC